MARTREENEYDVLCQHHDVVGEELAPQGLHVLAGLIIDVLLEEKLAQLNETCKPIDGERIDEDAEEGAA